jgi:hypothetical protein
VGARIEPGEPPAEALNVKLAALQISAINVGDFQLAARRRFEMGGDVEHLVVVEIQTGHGVVRPRLVRLLL